MGAGREVLELGTSDKRGPRGCAMIAAALMALLVAGSAVMIAVGPSANGEGLGRRLVMTASLLGFAWMMAFGARHFAQKVLASRLILEGGEVQVRRPLHRPLRVPTSAIASVAASTVQVSVSVDGNQGSEEVAALVLRLADGRSLQLYAPDEALRAAAVARLQAATQSETQ